MNAKIKEFLSWLEQTATGPEDATALEVGRALAWFHDEIVRIQTSADYSIPDVCDAICSEVFDHPNYEPLDSQ
jgi:hypothetical protein